MEWVSPDPGEVSVSCEMLIQLLTDYLDKRLPLSQRAALGLHLLLCKECRDYLYNFQATIQACRAAEQRFGPEHLTEKQTADLLRLFQGAVKS